MRKADIVIVARLYERYRSKALGYACVYVRREQAEDIVQDVFETIALKINQKALKIDDERVIGLLCIMIRNRCKNYQIRNRRVGYFEQYEQDSIEDTVDIEKGVLSKSCMDNIKEELNLELSIIQQDVLYLKAEGYSHKEIGQLIDRSESTVRQIYRRARVKAMKTLERSGLHEIREGKY